jgi:DNA helicase
MKDKDKVLALFNYISEISKNLKNTKTNIAEEKWFDFLENFPKHKDIIFEYKNLSEKYFEKEEGKLLEIRKPNFLKPLYIDEYLLEWIEGDWKDYRATLEVNEKIFVENTENGSGEIVDITPEIEGKIQEELEKRELWVEKQMAIEEARNFFDTLYIKYLELNKETETLELVIGNGIVRIKEQNVYYPVLLKKIKIDFNAKDNILILSDPHTNESFSPNLYTNFLNEIDDIHLENVFELEKEVKERNLHPLNRKETVDFFKKFIHSLTNRGFFIEDGDIEDLKEYGDIFIEDNPLIFIRKKETGIVKAIENITEKIENSGEIPAHLYELVGVASEEENENTEKDFREEEILFVKDANTEQVNIAKQIEKNNAVVVQGPPGTGKTHTIANLLGHFLAQGKNVLVTSQTKKALRVLKEKIPKSIQGLCISILDDDNSDMRKSVETISEKLGNFTSEKLKKEVEELEKIRIKECNDLENITDQMCGIRYRESKSIDFNGETFFIKDIAKYLRENPEIAGKIPGKISELVPCPITNDEFSFLKTKYRQQVSENEEKEIVSGLNNISDYLDVSEFEELVNDKKRTWKELEKLLNDNSFNIHSNILYVNGKEIIDLKKFKENYDVRQTIPKELTEDMEKWKVDAAISGGTDNGNKINWQNFIEDIKELHEYLNNLRPKLFKKRIDFSGIALPDAVKMIQELKNAFNNPGLMFGLNVKKAKNRIGSRITLNEETVKDVAECNLLLEYFNLLIQEKELKESWKELIENNGGISADSLGGSFIDYAFESVKEIEYFLNWNYKEKAKLLKNIENFGINRNCLFKETNISMEEIKDILNSAKNIEKVMEIGSKALKLSEKEEKYSLYTEKIKNITKKDSILDEKIKNAVVNEEIKEYSKNLKQLEILTAKQEYYKKREDILERINKTAFKWYEELKNGKIEEIEDICEVWKWKQLSQELEKLEKEPYEDLEKKAFEKRENIKKATLELVEKKSWYHVLNFIEKKENLMVSQALRGWEQTIQKIGKGTGKNASLYRKQAKEKMNICQKAVPAWIMPMNKVIDTLNPAENKFDVIIIDEASQSDISSLVLLYMAKKVIIVGDDKQVSPLDIGVSVEKVNSLREKYIKGKIINDDLYGLNSSLYSVAATTYRPLMLKEHFRCVPEIIGYSNKTSYDLKIKPLRESGSSDLKPAVINYKVPGMRDEKRKINELEAKTVVSLIKACIEMKEYADSSFGVISLLGDEQSDLIQKMIVEKIDVTDIEKHDILCGNSSHFQGDERDVIFLTMVDSNSGEVPLRVMTDGTESARKKRYNVAASRAKNQMWVVNSLDVDNDLKTGDIRKEFLEYVSSPKEMLLTEEMEKNSESVFEEKIAKYLISEGYHIEQQWEAGLYKIDMVALFQDKKVAIECDGEKWHSTEERIREDMERQNVLERCGWEFIRIRGSRYFKNPESAMKALIEELNRKGIYPESMEDKRYLVKEKELLNKIKNRALKIIKF